MYTCAPAPGPVPAGGAETVEIDTFETTLHPTLGDPHVR